MDFSISKELSPFLTMALLKLVLHIYIAPETARTFWQSAHNSTFYLIDNMKAFK